MLKVCLISDTGTGQNNPGPACLDIAVENYLRPDPQTSRFLQDPGPDLHSPDWRAGGLDDSREAGAWELWCSWVAGGNRSQSQDQAVPAVETLWKLYNEDASLVLFLYNKYLLLFCQGIGVQVFVLINVCIIFSGQILGKVPRPCFSLCFACCEWSERDNANKY